MNVIDSKGQGGHRAVQPAMCRARLGAFLLAAFLCGAVASAEAPQAPELISYQGVLYGQEGAASFTGVVNIEFRLYASETALPEEAVWAERHANVRVLQGAFSLYLGSGAGIEGTPHDALAAVFETAPLWLGVKAGRDAEMAQRQKILSIPYALTVTSAGKALHGVPAGTIVMYAGTAVPGGWLACEGGAISRAEHAALFAAIGTAWGAGDGSTTFNLPDFRGRAAIGAGAGVNQNTDTRFGAQAGLATRAAGAAAGAKTATVGVGELPPHAHTYTDSYGTIAHDEAGAYGTANGSLRDDTRRTDVTGGDAAHNDLQPTTYVNYIIKE